MASDQEMSSDEVSDEGAPVVEMGNNESDEDAELANKQEQGRRRMVTDDDDDQPNKVMHDERAAAGAAKDVV
eukprot:gene22153-32714_t